MSVTVEFTLGNHEAAVADRIEAWNAAQVGKRIWERDHTVWFPEPRPELTDRLGWLELPSEMSRRRQVLEPFAADVAAAGILDVVVLGMGGSSLAPEVFQHTFGSADGHPAVTVLDSTHPAAVRDLAERLDLGRTLFLVASKSGTTLETMSFFRFFWNRYDPATGGSHFAAITDPGTPLEDLARERGFRAVFNAPPDVGGRYSALTEFGLVPAALIGVDLAAMEAAARDAAAACGPDIAAAANPGLRLGAALGELAVAGRDKATFITTRGLDAFPAWIEQLIAESTGKDGTGTVPIVGELPATVEAYGDDRAFVLVTLVGEPGEESVAEIGRRLAAAGHPVMTIRLENRYDLAGAMFILEMATAAAGSVLGINPFDQPDVELAKRLAHRAMAGELEGADAAAVDATDPELVAKLSAWLDGAGPGGYLSLHAYLRPTRWASDHLQAARTVIRHARRTATTLDFGPRFLHSTGQLHKGGPDSGRFLQIIDDPQPELPIPETDHEFGRLIAAQAVGDFEALRSRGRSVLRVSLGTGGEAALRALRDALIAAAT